VLRQVYSRAAERYGVEVSSADVRDRIGLLLGGQDADTVFAQLAEQQGVSRQDVEESVREQLIRLEIAAKEGLDDPLSEEALRKRFEQTTTDPTKVRFGYITVPDQRTADQVVAALDADPARYAELAGRFAGDYTVEIQELSPDQIPGPLAQQAAAAEPGTAFAVPVQEVGGVVVGFVAPAPTFEELRPQLQQAAEGEVGQAAQPLVDKVRDDLDVVVNPRYGELKDDGQIKPAGDGVVKILEG
jgi:peptidyl-prolyl cis-trans isomerase SurA